MNSNVFVLLNKSMIIIVVASYKFDYWGYCSILWWVHYKRGENIMNSRYV